MSWGWYVVIAIAVLLALPLFVPLIVRVRAKPGELEWSVAVGHITVLPDFGERASRWKATWGRVGYVISRPLVWLFQLIALLLRVLTWPVRAPLAWRRKRRSARPRPVTPARPSVPEADIQLPPSEPADREEPQPDHAGAPGEPGVLDQGEDPSSPEPPQPGAGDDPPERDSSAAAPEADGDEPAGPDQPALPRDSEPPSQPTGEDIPTPDPPRTEHGGGRPPDRARPPRPGDEFDDDDGFEDTQDDRDRSADRAESTSRPPGKLARVLEQLATVKRYYDTYGRIGKRVLRAALLFVGDVSRAPRWRVFDLRWSAGGDPAALGQVLGWHHALSATIDPRLARHLAFTPQWDSEELALTGSARVQLEIWGYRFVPPVVKFFARLPWGGLIRLVWEQILSRRQKRKATAQAAAAS